MAEFVWKDQVKIITREWTRAEQMAFWARVLPGGDLNSLVREGSLLADEKLLEYVAVLSTVEVHIQNGRGWKPLTGNKDLGGFILSMPPSQEQFGGMPVSLANGWIEAAQQENGQLLDILNFTSRRKPVGSGATGSETPSGETP